MLARLREGRYFVYMVRCADGTYYTGSTADIATRLKLHDAGNGAKYLRGKGPVQLVYAKEYRYYKRALQAETRLKKLTRGEKQALIERYGRRSNLHPYVWSKPMKKLYLQTYGCQMNVRDSEEVGGLTP